MRTKLFYTNIVQGVQKSLRSESHFSILEMFIPQQDIYCLFISRILRRLTAERVFEHPVPLHYWFEKLQKRNNSSCRVTSFSKGSQHN